MSDTHALNFLEETIEQQIKNETQTTPIVTRFPPEPNGYLHLGHAKSICLNFGLAQKYKGITNLRFDDTNPETEETEYVNAIKEDIQWLGFQWHNEHYTSNYFSQLYQMAIQLIDKGLAYVDDLTSEDIAKQKGEPSKPGTESPYRNRTPEENKRLFEEMKQGKYTNGQKVLRAKIDMTSPNMHMRDPIIYRIKHVPHHRTKNEWCIYPMYDFAHGQSDAIEYISHSICTLEFEVHRPLYNWFIQQLNLYPSQQYEFARLNLTYTLMSKRKLLQLVQEQSVSGWDDPRMPTISGIRRRGYTPNSIRKFCEKIGVARRENIIDVNLLESCIREELNANAKRVMAVLDPIEIEITNYENAKSEILLADNNPEDPNSGSRELTFSKHIFIEREDFMEEPIRKFFRLSPTTLVRLKSAYILQYERCEKDEKGNIKKLYCTYFPNSKSGQDTSGIAVKGVIHWVDKATALCAEVRLYDRLFLVENPSDSEKTLAEILNPNSLQIIRNALIESSLATTKPEDRLQFMRKGYFCLDKSSTEKQLVFNRIVTLKDTWQKEIFSH